MQTDLTPDLVLAARAELPNLSWELYNDLYAATWGASHVRLQEIVASPGASLSLQVAQLLSSQRGCDFEEEEWLPNVRFASANAATVTDLIAMAMSELQEGWPNETLRHALGRQQIGADEQCYEVLAIDPARKPSSPYRYGPTHQVFWRSADRLCLLQVHLES